MIVESQSIQHIFYWSEDGAPEPAEGETAWESAELGFGSPRQAILFLRRFANLHEFRALLNEKFPGQTFRWQIDEIFARLADLMTRKRLCVQKRWKRATSSIASASNAAKVPRREAVEASEPKEQPTFLPSNDGAAQAGALNDAAS